MALKEINALIQIQSGTANEWSLVSVPLPSGVLAYAIDTKEFRLGDGTTLYADLPTFFDADTADAVTQFKNSFPDLANGANKILVVNEAGDNFTLTDISITDLITASQLAAALADKSAKVHTHNTGEIVGIKSAALRDVGMSPGQIPAIDGSGKLPESVIPAITGDNLEQENLLMYLLMHQLDSDNQARLHLVSGVVDEFETEEGIDTADIVSCTYNVDKYEFSPDAKLSSTIYDTEINIAKVHAMVRASFTGQLNTDFYLQMSRDGGTTWSRAALSVHKLSGEQIKILTGDVVFDGPEGSSLKWRIRTVNGATATVEGLGISWE